MRLSQPVDPNLIVTMTATTGYYGPKVVATSHSLFIDLDGDIVFDECKEGRYALVRLDDAAWYCERIKKWLIDGNNCRHEDCNGEPSGIGETP